jgi:hypothetical protein
VLADPGRGAALAAEGRRRLQAEFDLSASAERLRAMMVRHGVVEA